MKGSRKSFVRSLCLGVIVSVLVFFLSASGFLRKWENGIFDFLMWWETETRSSDIVLVAIDGADYKSIFHSTSPLSRRTLADAILKLSRSRPKVIGLDISLDGETAEDKDLIETVRILGRDHIPIVFPMTVKTNEAADPPLRKSGQTSSPPATLLAGSGSVIFGAVEYPLSRDGVIREMPLFKKSDRDMFVPSFPLSVAAAGAGLSREDLHHEIAADRPNDKIGGNGLAKISSLIRSGRHSPLQKIRFIGDAKSFNSLKFSQVIQLPPESFQPGNIFTDKIILVGGVFEESRDFYMTPKGMMSGLEIIANSVETLLHANPIRPINHVLELLIELVVVVVLSFFFFRFAPWKASLLSAIAILPLAIAGSAVAFSTFGRWLNFIPAALAVFLHGEFSVVERTSELKHEIAVLSERLREKEKEIAALRSAASKHENSHPTKKA